MRQAIITEDFAQALLNYLAQQRYADVFQLIQQISALQWEEVEPKQVELTDDQMEKVVKNLGKPKNGTAKDDNPA